MPVHWPSFRHPVRQQRVISSCHGGTGEQHACREAVNAGAVLKAMGVESDQEILALSGCQGSSSALLMPTLQDCKSLGVFTQHQALDYLGQHSL